MLQKHHSNWCRLCDRECVTLRGDVQNMAIIDWLGAMPQSSSFGDSIDFICRSSYGTPLCNSHPQSKLEVCPGPATQEKVTSGSESNWSKMSHQQNFALVCIQIPLTHVPPVVDFVFLFVRMLQSESSEMWNVYYGIIRAISKQVMYLWSRTSSSTRRA